MSSRITKGISKLTSGDHGDLSELIPDDRGYIRSLNYDELEEKYQIRKYHPRFIHNCDYSTPQIKEMICDKPIYTKANRRQNKANPATKRKTTQFDLVTGETINADMKNKNSKLFDRGLRSELRHEQIKDKKALRRQQREHLKEINEERKSLKEQQRKETSDEKDESRRILREHINKRKKAIYEPVPFFPAYEPRKHGHYQPQGQCAPNSHGNDIRNNLLLKNPFYSNQSTLVATALDHGLNLMSGRKTSTVLPETRKQSISSRLKGLLLGKPATRNQHTNLKRMKSFDQTKADMTTERATENNFVRLIESKGRRMSEAFQIVTESVNNGRTGELESIQYTQSQVVGHGSFGVVFQTQLLPSNEIAAIKRVLQDKRFKNRELQIMKLVHHRNVVDLKYYFYTNNDKDELYLNLILEFVPETLYKASHYYVSKRLSMPALEVKLYTYQMFRALNYIHTQGICHRDIKPQNLLINAETGVLKLCDFGSAKILNPAEPNVSYICSRYYRAPELIFGATNYTTKIDVWSAACVMAEMIVGQPLFPGESGVDQLVEIIKILGTPTREQIKCMNPNYTEYKFPQIKPIPLSKIFKKMSNDCINFLAQILEYSPDERISCIEALADPYFDELRKEDTKLPNYRKLFSQQFYSNSSHNPNQSNANYQLYSNQPDSRNLPDLFDFDDRELSMEPSLNSILVPVFARKRIRITRGSTLDDFVPMSEAEMKVTLE